MLNIALHLPRNQKNRVIFVSEIVSLLLSIVWFEIDWIFCCLWELVAYSSILSELEPFQWQCMRPCFHSHGWLVEYSPKNDQNCASLWIININHIIVLIFYYALSLAFNFCSVFLTFILCFILSYHIILYCLCLCSFSFVYLDHILFKTLINIKTPK